MLAPVTSMQTSTCHVHAWSSLPQFHATSQAQYDWIAGTGQLVKCQGFPTDIKTLAHGGAEDSGTKKGSPMFMAPCAEHLTELTANLTGKPSQSWIGDWWEGRRVACLVSDLNGLTQSLSCPFVNDRCQACNDCWQLVIFH